MEPKNLKKDLVSYPISRLTFGLEFLETIVLAIFETIRRLQSFMLDLSNLSFYKV